MHNLLTSSLSLFSRQEAINIWYISNILFGKIRSIYCVYFDICFKCYNYYVSVNECQRLFENGIQTYEVLITRGIIFKFKDGHELSFEKNIWFSEDITVEKGYDLIERFTPVEEFAEGWSGNYSGECVRELISFR